MIKTYVINLREATDRRQHIEKVVSVCPFLDVEFVEGVSGKQMSEEEINNEFDRNAFVKRYKKAPLLGEIGCTLSHRICYEKLVNSSEKLALILEDDALLSEDFFSMFRLLVNYVNETPQVVILTPEFTYTSQSKIIKSCSLSLCKVYRGAVTTGYLINTQAASLILEQFPYPSYLADDWMLLRKAGFQTWGCDPYLVSPMKAMPSYIVLEKKHTTFFENLCHKIVCLGNRQMLFNKLLRLIGHKTRT